jgi:hypothetical protein
VHVLNTNLAAVCLLVCLNQLFELPVLLSLEESSQLGDINEKFFFQICLGEAIRFVVEKFTKTSARKLEFRCKLRELLVVGLVKLQGVEISEHVTVSHVCSNQHHQLLGLLNIQSNIWARGTTSASTLLKQVQELLSDWVLTCSRRELKRSGGTALEILEINAP